MYHFSLTYFRDIIIDRKILQKTFLLTVFVLLSNSVSQTTFTSDTIDNPNYVYQIHPEDIDSDGDMDILAMADSSGMIAWYENDGDGNFTRQIINYIMQPTSIFAIDLDSDLDMDVITVSFQEGIDWYENDGNKNFSVHNIRYTSQIQSVFAIDLDSDNDIDLISAAYSDREIIWYENDGEENFTQHSIENNATGDQSVIAIDLDYDGHIDILSASSTEGILWYKNDGEENFAIHTITTNVNRAEDVYAIDVDTDGDLDILSASANDDKIAWYENQGFGIFIFPQHTITTEADFAQSVFAADLDNDNDVDVLSASQYDDKIAWYENDGNESFSPHVITTNADRAYKVTVSDLDDDGDLDVISGDFRNLVWYENHQPVYVRINQSLMNSEQSGDINIEYSLRDNEGNTIQLELHYSINNGENWQVASSSETTAIIDNNDYEGYFIWHSFDDLPSLDIENILIAIHRLDLTENKADTLEFHLDNNLVPEVEVEEISGEQSHDILFQLILSDTESDTLAITCSYRLDNEITWQPATISNPTENLLPGITEHLVTWQSFTDIPEYSGYAWFRIVPSDKDPGLADSIYLLVDNIGVPVIAELSQPIGEQDSDITFNYLILDDEADLVSITKSYSVDSINWHPATTEGITTNIDTFNYSGNIIWNSEIDLPGLDLFQVWFRMTPSDANSGVGFTTSSFHLDNNEIPALSVGLIDSQTSGSVHFVYEIQDAENDTINLNVEFSLNSVDWNNIISESIFSSNYQDTLFWDSFNDLGYGLHENITLRITPSDNDTGSTQLSNSFNVYNYAGDYNGDININYEDLIPFAVAWNGPEQDLTKEIGPAIGEPPLLIPQPDGIIDFKDLMVLVRQWNWSYDNGSFMGKEGLSKQSMSDPEPFIFNTLYNEDQTIEYALKADKPFGPESKPMDLEEKGLLSLQQSEFDPWQNQFADQLFVGFDSSAALMAFSLEILYDPEIISISSIDNMFLSERNGFSFKDNEKEPGVSHYSSVVLDQGNVWEMNPGILLELNITAHKEQKTPVHINSKMYNNLGELISFGQQSFEITGYDHLPDQYELFQNYPNPFNPQTAIKYQLPEASKVNLEIYNILGQKVTTLVNKQQQAGYYKKIYSTNDIATGLASGIYILHLNTKGKSGKRFIKNIKMLFVK